MWGGREEEGEGDGAGGGDWIYGLRCLEKAAYLFPFSEFHVLYWHIEGLRGPTATFLRANGFNTHLAKNTFLLFCFQGMP